MRKLVGGVLGGLLFCWAAGALAKGGEVSQTVGHGEINWSQKTITATGSGAPSLKATNVAAARLGAERAAKMDALRNIIEAVKGVRVSDGQSAGDMMASVPTLRAKVEGVVRGFKVLDTKYYSDGGVDLIVQVALDGVLTEVLMPNAGSKAEASGDSGGVTGVIINAKGLGVKPALAPRILDDKGVPVFAPELVRHEAIARHGVCGYSSSLDTATKDGRVADKPLIIRAVKLAKQGGSDLVVSAADAGKLKKLASVLADGKVIIVVD